MTVYLSPDLSDKGQFFIIEKLKAPAKWATFNHVNQKKALTDFRAQLANYAPNISQDEELLKLIHCKPAGTSF